MNTLYNIKTISKKKLKLSRLIVNTTVLTLNNLLDLLLDLTQLISNDQQFIANAEK